MCRFASCLDLSRPRRESRESLEHNGPAPGSPCSVPCTVGTMPGAPAPTPQGLRGPSSCCARTSSGPEPPLKEQKYKGSQVPATRQSLVIRPFTAPPKAEPGKCSHYEALHHLNASKQPHSSPLSLIRPSRLSRERSWASSGSLPQRAPQTGLALQQSQTSSHRGSSWEDRLTPRCHSLRIHPRPGHSTRLLPTHLSRDRAPRAGLRREQMVQRAEGTR